MLLLLRPELSHIWLHAEVFVVKRHIEHTARNHHEHQHDKSVLVLLLGYFLAHIGGFIELEVIGRTRNELYA